LLDHGEGVVGVSGGKNGETNRLQRFNRLALPSPGRKRYAVIIPALSVTRLCKTTSATQCTHQWLGEFGEGVAQVDHLGTLPQPIEEVNAPGSGSIVDMTCWMSANVNFLSSRMAMR
jgi:hypothetical protein